jgi:hypothetical protein
MSSIDPTLKPPRPLWREPFMLGLFSLVIVASAAVMMRQPDDSARLVDPTKPAAAPGGGAFCDTPAPLKSTAYNPSTQFVK